MRFFKKTNILFMQKRRTWYFISATVILAGLVSLFIRGIDFGIDFLGGTELVVSFHEPVEIGSVRSAMNRIGIGQAEIKTFGTEKEVLIRTELQGEGTSIGDQIRTGLAEQFPTNTFTVLKEDKIGPKVGAELRRDALYAVVASLIAILLYIGIRFKFVYGVGAVVALFHDVLVTLGLLSICSGIFPQLNLEISQNIVAAFLTLVGLSVNDTVVIFDRIRENQNNFRTMKLIDLVNKSINETLSRTIITSGTIVLVLVVLFLLGGEVNRGFAFTLLIGIVTGTYSSIYVASAIVIDWAGRAEKNTAAVAYRTGEAS
jgi:preprotein translocase subunit SecF